MAATAAAASKLREAAGAGWTEGVGSTGGVIGEAWASTDGELEVGPGDSESI